MNKTTPHINALHIMRNQEFTEEEIHCINIFCGHLPRYP